jgi:membrane-bound lytic murein transglycosylase B
MIKATEIFKGTLLSRVQIIRDVLVSLKQLVVIDPKKSSFFYKEYIKLMKIAKQERR